MNREYWYILSCSRGKEEQVRSAIISVFENSKYKDKLKDVVIIRKKVKNNLGVERFKNVYPGYIYINLELNNETWFMVRNVTNVFSFIGSTGNRTKPIPLTQKEVLKLKNEMSSFDNTEAYFDIKFEPGNTVLIKKHNIFSNQKGTVTSVNLKTGEVTVDVNFMNKKHKLNLNYKDIKKG